jgi:hypothetical protein
MSDQKVALITGGVKLILDFKPREGVEVSWSNPTG